VLIGSVDACRSGNVPQRATFPSVVSHPEPVIRGQLPAVSTRAVGPIMTCVAATFVRDWEVRERRNLIAQTSAEHVEALKRGDIDHVQMP
jgi:hypothetical protein